jgi:DNA-binding transcriptional MerR regulator
MTTAGETSATLSIGEVAALTGLTAHTLRFYEQEDLFVAPVRRNAAGRRLFTSDDVAWLKVCSKLRSSGMPLPEIRRYAQLAREGTGNEAERLQILLEHEQRVQQQAADLQDALAIIHAKAERYTERLAAGGVDQLRCDEIAWDGKPVKEDR